MKICSPKNPSPDFEKNISLRQQGLSYIEVLIATAILAVALVPAINALYPAIAGSSVYQSETEIHYHLTAKLEEVLAQPFDELYQEAKSLGDEKIPSGLFSDPIGSSTRRLVFLSNYQPVSLSLVEDPLVTTTNSSFSTADSGLLWIAVQLESNGLRMASLVSRYE